MRRAARAAHRFLVEVAAIIATAWVTFVGLRAAVAERYQVATPSMEPTLHGAAVGGDVVLVDKTAFWGGHDDLRRFDLVVVRDPDAHDGNLLVKRFIAAGPATLAIVAGDLLVENPATGSFEPLAKHPLRDADLLLTAFETSAGDSGGIDVRRFVPAAGAAGPDGALVLDAAPQPVLLEARRRAATGQPRGSVTGLDGHLSTARPVDTGFVDRTGRTLGASRGFPRDLGLEVDVALTPGCAALHVVLESVGEFFGVRIDRDGIGAAFRDGVRVDPEFTAAVLGDGKVHRVGYGHLDGFLWVAVDGRLAARWPSEVPARFRGELRLGDADPAPIPNRLHVAAEGSGGALLFRFRAFHDALLRDGGDSRHHLEPGDVFLLGDNVHDSADSRSRPDHPFRLADLVGRPIAVVAPADRRRWLDRDGAGGPR